MYSIPEIRLYRQTERLGTVHANCWVAQFVNDPDIISLFGTDTLPTAFTAQADPITVLREIQRLNPRHLVTLPV